MALMTARRLVVRGRPPGRAAGSIGATSAQASSVKSVSYNSSVFSTNQLYTDSGKLFKHPLTTRDPLSLTKELQQAVWAVDSEQPVTSIRTMDEIVDDELASRAQVLRLLAAFAGLALLLASLGIYGVLSYVVSQRTREIGLRMAIGASQWDIVRAMLGYSARITGTGLAIGIVTAIGATRLLATLLFGISPLDPLTFTAVSVVLAAVAFAASFVPTRRAASLDPMLALREE